MSNQDAVSEFSSDQFQISVSHNPGCLVTVTITATPDFVQQCRNDAVKKIKKQISVPGFRKGKAPDKMVMEQFAKPIDQEWHEQVANTALVQSFGLTKVIPFSRDSIKNHKVKSISLEEGAELEYQYEAQPTVPEVDKQTVAISDIQPEPVDDKAMEDETKTLILRMGEWTEVEGRAAQKGDRVRLDIEMVPEEGEPETVQSDRGFLLDETGMAPWMIELVEGLKTGESAEGMSRYDGDNEHLKENFDPQKYRVTVKKIEECADSDLTDDIAKRAGAENVDELREKMRKKLESQHQANAQFKRRKELAEKLLETYAFEVPQSMVEGERAARLRNMLEEAMVEQGLNEEQIREMAAEIEGEARRLAEHNQRLFFLLRESYGDQIEIKPEDVSNEATRQIMMVPQRERTIHQAQERDELYMRGYIQVFIERALDRLLEEMAAQNA